MPIKVFCGGCSAMFQAKDALAGKKVKCPKCSAQIVVGESKVTGASVSAPANVKPSGASGGYNPMLGLLDEAKVKTVSRGALCPNCSAELKPKAVLCVECGFNLESGERVRRVSQLDDDDELSGMSETEKMMAKAERDIDDMPVSSAGQDFGDGGDSFFIALVAGVILTVLVGLGMLVVFSMETLTKTVTSSGAISFFASVFLILAMTVWITIVAFKQSTLHGIVCVFTGGLWCVVYGFMQGRQLIVPTIILLFSFIIGIAAGVWCYYNGFGPQEEFKKDLGSIVVPSAEQHAQTSRSTPRIYQNGDFHALNSKYLVRNDVDWLRI
jgi:DNA-directed RNA polymerase subunit RPC12/RpoP